jgi:hypothetical protein
MFFPKVIFPKATEYISNYLDNLGRHLKVKVHRRKKTPVTKNGNNIRLLYYRELKGSINPQLQAHKKEEKNHQTCHFCACVHCPFVHAPTSIN